MNTNKLNNATMNNTSFTVSEAQNLFQKLPLETQQKIKNDKQKVYNAIYSKDPLIDSSLLEWFLDQYEPLLGKINTFDDFEKLNLETQVFFKDNFPAEYEKIMNLNPNK